MFIKLTFFISDFQTDTLIKNDDDKLIFYYTKSIKIANQKYSCKSSRAKFQPM